MTSRSNALLRDALLFAVSYGIVILAVLFG